MNDIAKVFGTVWVIAFLYLLFFGNTAEAVEKRWHLSEVQYQISPDCSHDITLYSHRAAAALSKHSVVFSEGLDAVYVRCDYSNPFVNELRSLPDGVASQDEELTLGVTRTTWYVETLQVFRAEIWIDPLFAPAFGYLEGVVYHEWIHALGLPHVDGGVMQYNSTLNYIDGATLHRIRQRYDKPRASMLDSEGDFYLSCLWVPREVAALVGASQGFYEVQTRGGEVVSYVKTECE